MNLFQNDNHDQQNDDSSSNNMHTQVLFFLKGYEPATHRALEVHLFNNLENATDNDNYYLLHLNNKNAILVLSFDFIK